MTRSRMTIFNDDNLAGEDLIVYPKGTGKISLLGNSLVYTREIDKREIMARASIGRVHTVELFDNLSGDYLGTRELSGSNSFLFRNFDWQFDNNLVDGDTFYVRNSTPRKDDASNLLNFAINRICQCSYLHFYKIFLLSLLNQ